MLTALSLAACAAQGAETEQKKKNEPYVSKYKVSSTNPYADHMLGEYVQVAESDTYRLYYYEPRFSILLENKKTGAIIESTVSDENDDGRNNKSWTGYMKSGIVLYAIVGTTNTYQVDVNTCKSTKIKTGYIPGGISADITFGEYGFSLTVEVTLEGDDLVVRVPEGSIKETKNGKYISTISLFPFMGYSYLDAKNGYMLLPDGNGALIYLDDKEGRYSTGFSKMVYGDDAGFDRSSASSYLWDELPMVTGANKVMAPVFGMTHTDERQGYLAIVESGDERCTIECQPNGVMIDYNRCFARFLIRDVYVQPLNNSNSGTVKTVEHDRTHQDLQVRYCLLSGEDADYSGMAATYRDYLLENGLIKESDCGYNTRIDFLGTEREEFLLGTTAVTMTTVNQIRTIYSELRSAGMDSVLTVYKGWQKGGRYNFPISGYKADSHIGGTGALTELIRDEAEKGYSVYLYNDAQLVNAVTNPTTFNVMKMVNKRTYKYTPYRQVYDLFYCLTPGKTESTLDKFIAGFTAKGINTLAVAGISDSLFSYSSKGSYYTRADTRASYMAALEKAGERCDLLLESPNAYMWKYTGAYLDMPMGSSDYLYVDKEVPFMSLVLKGVLPMYSEYVNFEANKTENFLQMVESGIYPSFYLAWEDSSKLIYTDSSDLYSLDYASYKDTILEYDAQLRALARQTAGARIRHHDTLDNGLVKVSYENGVVIYVNYTKQDLTADGLTVPALSYKVGDRT